MGWNKIIKDDNILKIPYAILLKSDDYQIQIVDFGKCLGMSALADKTFTLPDVGVQYLYKRLFCYNLGDMKLTILPFGTGTIEGESEISSSVKYAFIELVLMGSNIWEVYSVGSNLITTSGYYGGWVLA
jgi:hypothetical protein